MQKISGTITKRVFGLDIMRATAIILVLFAHTCHLLFSNNFAGPINKITGFLGVEIFFVLSGFLIGGILFKTFPNKESISWKALRTFWMRRWLRTIPIYYLVLGAVFCLQFFIKNNTDLLNISYLSYIFFLQNFFHAHPGFFDIAWSLSVEEWFYIFFPVLFLLAIYVFNKRKIATIVTIIFFIIGCLLLKVMATNFLFDWSANFRTMVPFRLDAIAFGVGAVFFKNYFAEFCLNNRKTLLVIGVIISLSLLLFFTKIIFVGNGETFFLKTFFFPLVSLGISMTVPFFDNWKATEKKWLQKSITHISIISYSLYLIHIWLIGPMVKIIHQPTLSFIFVWIVSIGIASIMYFLIELPIMKLRSSIS